MKRIIMLLLLLSLTACATQEFIPEGFEEVEPVVDTSQGGFVIQTGNNTFTMELLDIGTGQAILLQQYGSYALIDTGKNTQRLIKELEERNVNTIDLFVVSHADFDHAGVADTIIEDYNVGTFIDNGQTVQKEFYEDYKKSQSLKNPEYIVGREGKRLEWNNITFTIMNPSQQLYSSDTNDNSIVLWLQYEDIDILIPGDCEAECESYLVKQNIDPIDILVVSHHGSKTSSGYDFLEWAVPHKQAECLISNGKDNPYNHPEPLIVTRLEGFCKHILQTGAHGDIIVRSNGLLYGVGTENPL